MKQTTWEDEIAARFPEQNPNREWPWQQPVELLRHELGPVRRFANWMQSFAGAPSRLHYQQMGENVRRRWIAFWLRRDPPSQDTVRAFESRGGIAEVVFASLADELPELE